MRDKHYKTRPIRLDDSVWEALKEAKEESQLSWNLFIKDLYEKATKRRNNRGKMSAR